MMYLPGWQRFSKASSTQFWACCATLALAFSWFIPNHPAPLYDFFNDVWIAGFMGGVYVWALAKRRLTQPPLVVPAAAVLMFGLALIALAHWATGLVHYSGQAVLTMTYLLAAALAVTLAFVLAPKERTASLTMLLGAILMASLANAVILFIQKTGLFPKDDISFPGFLVFQISSSRPTGNLGQANQMATLLVWGLLSAWWFWHKQQMRLTAFVASSAILAMALVCTQSRIAYLNIFILGCIGALTLLKHRLHKNTLVTDDVKPSVQLKYLVAVPVFWLVLILGCYALIYALELFFDVKTDLRKDLLTDSVRTVIYPLFLKASLNQFWFGYGWTHLARAQMDLPLDGVQLGVYFLHSHNLFIDLLLWLGVPLGFGAICAILWGLFWIFKNIESVESYILVVLLVVLLGHALVEYPHMYAYFLMPAAWVVGLLAANFKAGYPSGVLTWFYLRPFYLHSIALLLMLVLVACVWDHNNITRELMWIRLKTAKIKMTEPAAIERAIVLNHFQDRLHMQDLAPVKNASDDYMEWARKAALGYPSPVTHYNLICLLAVNGRADEAQQWMHRLNRVVTKDMAHAFTELWNNFRKEHANLALAAWPVSGVLLFQPIEKSTGKK